MSIYRAGDPNFCCKLGNQDIQGIQRHLYLGDCLLKSRPQPPARLGLREGLREGGLGMHASTRLLSLLTKDTSLWEWPRDRLRPARSADRLREGVPSFRL